MATENGSHVVVFYTDLVELKLEEYGNYIDLDTFVLYRLSGIETDIATVSFTYNIYVLYRLSGIETSFQRLEMQQVYTVLYLLSGIETSC